MLGVINYFGKFVPALAEKTGLLRQLINKDAVFVWAGNCEREWEHLCKCLSGQPLLAIFNPQRDTKITSDASQNGIGSALLQRYVDSWKPVAYVSRVLTEAQKRYSQIEKEAVAVVVGCAKFHHFAYGRRVLETDHRPFEAISKKSVGEMPPRLQRFFRRLLKYYFQLLFLQGKQLVLADMLSRASIGSPEKDGVYESVEIHAVSAVS